MGDMNCNLLDSSANAEKVRLVEMLPYFSFSKYVTQPTFSSGSLLDVVICNSSDVIKRVHAFKCPFSPHFIRVLLRLPKSHKKPVRVRIRLLKRVDQFSLTSDLHLVDWSGVFSGSSVSEM